MDLISWMGRYSQKGPEEFDECRGALAPPCRRVRQAGGAIPTVFVPTLGSIKNGRLTKSTGAI